MPPNDLILFRRSRLTDADVGGQTSTVGEPSLANNGREILLTGNWYATRSLDSGATWAWMSPYNQLPPASGGFCCDQVVHYDRSRDLTFWLLQYTRLGPTNTLRLAVKRGATLGNTNWVWWDFQPASLNPAWGDQWFDYPDLELSNDFLYITSNVFRSESWTRSVIFRLPLDTLAGGGQLRYSHWATEKNFSLRCARGATDRMYFASHNTTSEVRVWTWPETAETVTAADVNVSTWNAGTYSAPGPDGSNWLRRCDPRITAAWVGGGTIGLAWTANRRGTRPWPYVRVVAINERTMAAAGDADIWSANHAYAYPDACPNDRGHVGISLFRGGGNRHPGHVVGVWDDMSTGWQLATTVDGTNGPVDLKWGDYVACRRHSPEGLTWLAAGYTLQGGDTRNEIEPCVVHFGRQRDERAVQRWAAA